MQFAESINPSRGASSSYDADEYPSIPLASRMARFVASIVDTAIGLLIGAPFLLLASLSPGFVAVLLVPMLGLAYVQISKIVKQGQSLGKEVMHIRILRRSGARAGFLHGVFLRSMLLPLLTIGMRLAGACGLPADLDAAAGVFSAVFSLVSVLDVVLILGPARRTIHDRLADTIVALA